MKKLTANQARSLKYSLYDLEYLLRTIESTSVNGGDSINVPHISSKDVSELKNLGYNVSLLEDEDLFGNLYEISW